MRSYAKGLQEVGDGLFAYLQPDGGWGWSNAGLVVDGERTLLVDTLFDLRLTEEMLQAMRRAVPAAARIDTLVNTHANGDHCYGNQLVGDARDRGLRADGRGDDRSCRRRRWRRSSGRHRRWASSGRSSCAASARSTSTGIELVLPEHTFSGELTLHVGDRALELIEVGPAHTRGDTLVHVPSARVLFTGDILFSGGHPIVWAGPASNWIAACDRILAMDVEVIVPGHGPLAGPDAVRELKAYLEYLYDESRVRRDEGMTALQAAQSISLERWADWGESERLAVNVANIYAELAGDPEPLNPLAAFEQMAELARSR